MIKVNTLKEQLSKTMCYKCGTSLENAEVVPVTEAPMAIIAHTVCSTCRASGMLTITSSGSGIMPMVSDLNGIEIKKFIDANKISIKELLKVHKTLKKESLWKLLQQKEKY